MNSSVEISLVIGRSRYLTLGVLLFYTLLMVTLLLHPLRFSLSYPLVTLLFLHLIWLWRHCPALAGETQRLQIRQQRWWLERRGTLLEIEPPRQQFVSAWLLLLRSKAVESGQRVDLIIMADSGDREPQRRLRRLLLQTATRHHQKSGEQQELT
ncbi:MAG: hypothetical protein HQL49_13780 [Gammaproteobacteria bacterium]|nr:hypothetical protein [Gammaproteobacteria bacterium]